MPRGSYSQCTRSGSCPRTTSVLEVSASALKENFSSWLHCPSDPAALASRKPTVPLLLKVVPQDARAEVEAGAGRPMISMPAPKGASTAWLGEGDHSCRLLKALTNALAVIDGRICTISMPTSAHWALFVSLVLRAVDLAKQPARPKGLGKKRPGLCRESRGHHGVRVGPPYRQRPERGPKER
jgi:hypothetical protein